MTQMKIQASHNVKRKSDHSYHQGTAGRNNAWAQRRLQLHSTGQLPALQVKGNTQHPSPASDPALSQPRSPTTATLPRHTTATAIPNHRLIPN